MDHTPNFRLNLPAFDYEPWDSDVNSNFTVLDALVNTMVGVPGFVGVWLNSTAYSVGQVAVDAQIGSMWQCLVSHTSAVAPTTFAQDRTAHPTYWMLTKSSANEAAEDAQQAAADAATSAADAAAAADDAADSAAAAADSAASAIQDVTQLRADAVLKAGSTMTGQLQLNADPATALAAATKQYVDAAIAIVAGAASITVGDTPPASPKPGALWFDSVGTQLFVWYNDGTSSQWVVANNIAPTGASAVQQPGFNFIHNARFSIAQRGTGPWTTPGPTLDRWTLAVVGDTTQTWQFPIADAGRALIGDEEASYSYNVQFTGNAAAGALTRLDQRIEGVRRLAGKTVTVSFWAKCASGTPKLGINGSQVFGTGGSPSAGLWALATGVAVTIGTTWQRYTATFVYPSIAGKTLGTNGDDYTGLSIWFSSGATFNAQAGNIGVQSGVVDLWGVQLEIGGGATTLMRRDPSEELALCQRFYQTGWTVTQSTGTAGGGIECSSVLAVAMRATPTMTTAILGQTNVTATSMAALNNQGVKLFASPSSSGNCRAECTWTASADL